MSLLGGDTDKTEQPSLGVELSHLQRAIKARALRTIENQENQPRLSVRRKLVFAGLSILTVVGLIVLINYGVAIMQRIFELWMEDDAPVVTQPEPGQPFYITVDPPSGSAANSSQTGHNKTSE